jgi:Ala-tRNA(Pro) deacylase
MDKVLIFLNNLGIQYKIHEHPAVFTVAEADQYYKDIDGGKSKNLFLRNKNKSNYYLVILEGSKRLDLDALRTTLNESKLSFASSEDLKNFLGLTPGAVSPFGLISDKAKQVKVIIDQDLWDNERLHYHPNVNTATLELSRNDFKKFLDYCGNTVTFTKI